ncbi:hypothetical protein LNKW23_32140 [Paralimibaculum aggregatum]|uniref:RiboL-PSP-HEPN domain-containing protein n=1 Tax=Paralimibaculum aggregatum TaxID=3036245 RepID=A0ABQ6LLC2_9RHOB|nr:hypothetical protein [Limibaculum sp. NKW23]GMG84000.1 hypothetical protein LNKW23_32140 [Limibaculum sp. NKW23]
MVEIHDYVNEPPQSTRMAGLSGMFSEVSIVSPVDQYLRSARSLIAYGTDKRLRENDFLGRLLLLGVISASESYFRSILAHCLEMCPVCKKAAGEKSVNLGGALWHGQSGFSRSAFEHLSFSSADELKKATNGFLGVKLEDAKFRQPLEEYETVCQLRHGIVHNDGILPGRNAVQLGVEGQRKPMAINVDFAKLQEAAAVIETLVVSVNRELFSVMCKRWAIDWRQGIDWDENEELKLFKNIWAAFDCKEEKKRRTGRSRLTFSRCLHATKVQYALI